MKYFTRRYGNIGILYFGFSMHMVICAPEAPANSLPNGSLGDDASYALRASAQHPSTTMTGDWGGARLYLRNKGIDLAGAWTNETAGNVTGGDRHTAAQTNQLAAIMDIDAEKLLKWKGASFNFTFTTRWGSNLITRAGLYTLQQPQEVWGRGQTSRLTQLWYNQKLGDHVSFKIGRLPTGADFDNVPCLTMVNYFCGATTGNMDGNRWLNWPVSTWGGLIKYNDPRWYFLAGAYEQNVRNLDNKFFLGYVHGATGVLLPFETGLRIHLGAHHYPGVYRIGGWLNTASAPDILLAANGQPAVTGGLAMLERGSTHGGYLWFQQQLTGTFSEKPGQDAVVQQGLTAYVTFTMVDKETSPVSSQVTGSLRYLGLPWRRHDAVTLAVGTNHVNSRLATLDWYQAGRKGPRRDSEFAIETDYTLQITPWVYIEPNIQFWVNPGGYTQRETVTVIGMKTGFTF